MSSAARSLFVFGTYAVLAGLGLIVAPGLILGLLGFPQPADNWVRVLGVLAVCVGLIHVTAARNESASHFRASVPIRAIFAAGLAALVAAGQMPAPLLLFAAADAAGALWTFLVLRRGSAPAPATAT